MLKLLYKTLLVSVLSCSLLLLDFGHKGLMVNSAMAESVKTEKINDKDLMGTLTMTVVGVLTKRMYTYKPTTDILLAAAGGTIFLSGEVLAYIKLKDVIKGMEQEITRDKYGNVNKEQIESLERLKKSYEEAKKTANTKKMLQMAAAAAFAAAAVAAYTMAAQDLANLTACTTGVTTALSTASEALSSCSGPQAPACTSAITTCISTLTAYSKAISSYELSRQAVGPSAAGLTTATGSAASSKAAQASCSPTCSAWPATASIPAQLEGACTAKYLTDAVNMSGGSGLVGSLVNSKMDPADLVLERKITRVISVIQLFEKGIEFIFPSAKAELFSAMGIASSLAISYLLATSATLGPSIDMFMLIPQKRAIVWGILSGLTFAATTSTNNVIAQIETNIKKIDEILKSMYSMADGATGTNIARTTTAPIQSTIKSAINNAAGAVNYEAVDLSKSINGTLPCATGEEGQKCKPFEEVVKDLPSYAGLNAESQLQLSSILKTASGMNGTSTISAATMNNASKLAGQSNALKSSMDKAKAASIASLKKSGSNLDINAESKKLSDQIEKAINDNLKKNNTDASGMLASLSGGGGKFGGSSATSNRSASEDAAKKAEAEALAAALARAKGGVGANAVNINAGTSDKMDLGLTGVDNGSNGQMSAEELAAYNATAKKAASNMDDYDIKNDISKDSGANLFELISNRYKQSGYPRLFKLKEAESATTQAVKN